MAVTATVAGEPETRSPPDQAPYAVAEAVFGFMEPACL